MRLRFLSLFAIFAATTGAFAQGASSFKINEVYIASSDDAQSELKDEYGDVSSWIEIVNTSYTTRNIRSCYLTNDRRVLNEELSVPQRVAMMSLIPRGDERTNLTAKRYITFFADGNTNRGTLHANFKLEAGKANFIALYDGNGKTLLDSVTVPANLKPGHSYARICSDPAKNEYKWVVAGESEVTPNSPNRADNATDDKVREFKEKDPHGIAMAVMSMSVVFGCLVLLYLFFQIFGWAINRINMITRVKAIRKIHEQAVKMTVIAKQGTETQGIEMENYVAVITLALHEYQGNMHDVESGILTIKHEHSAWDSKDHVLRQQPIHHPQTNH